MDEDVSRRFYYEHTALTIYGFKKSLFHFHEIKKDIKNYNLFFRANVNYLLRRIK